MSEKSDGGSNFFDSAEPTNAGELLHVLRVTVCRTQLSVDESRLHGVNRNSGSSQFARESAWEAADPKLGCNIHRHAGNRCRLSVNRADVDNPPPLLRKHPTRSVLR